MAEGGGGGVRLHVGGLGESVGQDDLLKIFSPMGSVDSVEFVRTKGRSFAYIDFSPSSENSLTKLFSTYNGCVWKGGRLRLEKAKEHYLARLKREWEQESSPSSTSDDSVVQAPDDSVPPPTHLNIFVPKLRKVKAMPISGTGKHKYSFQRVAVPSLLPKSFCDCEEHSPSLTPHENHVRDLEALNAGINEEEVNIMNSVMSKLFQKNNISKNELVPEQSNVPEQESEIEEDQDNLIINVVSNGKDMMKDLINSELDVLSRKRKLVLDETTANGEGNTEGRKEKQIRPSKKRQSEGSERKESSKASREKTKQSKVDPDKSSDELSRMIDVKPSNDNVAWSQKSSWKALMANGNSGSFSVTSVLPDVGSSEVLQPAFSNTDFAWPTVKTKTKKKKSKRLTSTIMAEDLPVVDEIERDDAIATTDDVVSDHSEEAVTDTCVEAEPLEPVSSPEGEIEDDNLNMAKDDNVAEDYDAEKESLVLDDNVGQDDVDEEEPGKGTLEACSKSTRGSSWTHRTSWTQLVSETNSSFSLTQLFPDSNSDKCEPAKVINEGDGQYSNSKQGESGTKQGENTSVNSLEAAGVHVDSTPVRSLEDNRQSLKDKNVSAGSRLCVRKPIRRNIGSGETCTFMRSGASLNEWKKAKKALSGPRKGNKSEDRVRW